MQLSGDASEGRNEIGRKKKADRERTAREGRDVKAMRQVIVVKES